MKAGIVTFQRADNYGSLLQCYALYKSIMAMGVEAEVVDYRNPYIERAYVGLPNFQKNFIEWGKKAVKRYLNYDHVMKKHQAYEELIKEIKYSRGYKKREILKDGLDYDVIFAGSDQIWNPVMTNGFDKVYFLNFPGNFVKCSYAASLGNSNSGEYKKEKFLKLIKDFDFISMRERSACETIYNCTKIKTDVCVDPTLLVDRSEWEKLAAKSDLDIKKDYIVLYYLDGNKELHKIAEYLSEKYSCEIICCNKNPVSGKNITWLGDLGPVDFLALIRGAKAVVASSFHASVFSVIFDKQLYATLHPVTGERTRSLSEICGFSSRLYDDFEDFKQKFNENDVISYDYKNLENTVRSSKNFIEKAIEEARKRG